MSGMMLIGLVFLCVKMVMISTEQYMGVCFD